MLILTRMSFGRVTVVLVTLAATKHIDYLLVLIITNWSNVYSKSMYRKLALDSKRRLTYHLSPQVRERVLPCKTIQGNQNFRRKVKIK